MKDITWLSALSFALLALPTSTAFKFKLLTKDIDPSLNLEDEATRISGLKTIFPGDATLVMMEGIEWEPSDIVNGSNILVWETSVNGVVSTNGTIELTDNAFKLPTSIEAGSIVVSEGGTTTVSVKIALKDSPENFTTASSDYQTISKVVSLFPIILILILAFTTQMVELALFLGIWLGAWILTGSFTKGFESTIVDFLVGALADEGHAMVILFSVFLSGVVGMMEKSGGMLGFTKGISKVANTARTGQLACMLVGILIFFDDYANVLLTGETMKPLMDVLFVSREKLSFIVDATSAPVASISPVSSWVGFEVGLVQEAIDEIKKRAGDQELTIPEKGFAVFLNSIWYSYYSLFMLGLIVLLIATQRDYGPMLVAERDVRVYDRTDGGRNASNSGKVGSKQNEPAEDQPLYMHNMLIPVAVLIIFVFTLLVQTGTVEGVEQTFIEKIEGGDSYLALLYGTMGTAWISLILYLLQITIPGTGKLAFPTPSVVMDMMPWRKSAVEERGDLQPRFLLTCHESLESFLFGMARIFLAIVILTLAWACGSIMTTVGVDRLFSAAITGGGIPYQILPTLTFVIALLLALATGTSWGTMSILFPLLLVPTYEASDGNPQIFYATVSAVLGGAVAGDHMSPISDTTVLTSLACDIELMGHVNTQAPYVFWVVLFSVLCGYIPVGYSAYPTLVGIVLGYVACALFVFFVCVPVLSPTGSWDIFTKLFCSRSAGLQVLAADCVNKVNGESNNDDKEKKSAPMECAVEEKVESPKEVESKS